MRPLRTLVLGLAAVVLPTAGYAQSRLHPRWEIPGFDFTPNGVWRVRARQVAAYRAALLARHDFATLNFPMALGPAAAAGPSVAMAQAFTGTLQVPAVLFKYKDTPALPAGRDTSDYTAVLFSTIPPLARPYTVRTFYEEMSNGLVSIQGRALGYAALDSNEITYAGTPPCSGNPFGTTNCNGLFTNSQTVSPLTRMQRGLTDALRKIDSAIAPNWALYDSDNDGFVDVVIFVQPARDGACGGASNNHLWSHEFFLLTPYVTKTPWPGHLGNIQIQNYTMQSGVGGATACDSTSIMPIGTAAHEAGHGFGLPDLYDTQANASEGIGEWGLMGSGNYTRPLSPSRMEAWSLNELGWVTIAPLTTTNAYTLGPVATSHNALLVRPTGSNSRGEYFLLENRQGGVNGQSDSAMIAYHCLVSGNPAGCGGGLLIWHIDSTQIVNHRPTNDINAGVGTIHGVELLQADGKRNLDTNTTLAFPSVTNRGDAGDPYPGVSGNTKFSFRTNPAALKNVDGSFVGFDVDQIIQVTPGGPMSFRLQFGSLTIVRASDTAAIVTVDGANYNVFRDLFDDLSTHQISVAATQLSADGRTQYSFVSWSDGGAMSHPIIGSLSGAADTAKLARSFKLVFSGVNGTVTPSPSSSTTGSFVPENTSVTLTASSSVGGASFAGWSGDTTSTNTSITLPMARPYMVTATFQTALAITTTDPRPNGVMGASYADTLKASGGTGTYTWSLLSGALPPGLAISAAGIVSGIPTKTGTFQYQAQVSSGTLQQLRTFNMSVAAPNLATSAVVNQLLNGTGTLTTDELRYLDLLGNNNSSFDVGDFLAWVQATGAPLTAAAAPARTARTARRAGGRP